MGMTSLFKKAVKTVDAPRSAEAEESSIISDTLIAHRYCLMLNRKLQGQHDERTEAAAWKRFESAMSLIPSVLSDADDENAVDGGIYMDRFTVTNGEFAHFVSAGGYGKMELWPQAIWPNVLQFVDQTGYPGPRFWNNGRPPKGKDAHPVVGVSWYEARAYALWVGKRLPTGREWESASAWCCGSDGRKSNRYPWGNSYDPKKANTWSSGHGSTVPVEQYRDGATPNGIHHLIGNVWEWVSTRFQLTADHEGYHVTFEEDMAEIRGGAFNTYFEEQATCQFRSGQPFLYRGDNVGFRCCLPARDVKDPPQPTAFV